MPSYEDFSAALSDAPSFTSEYPPPSNRNSLMSSTQLSPVASPRMTPQGRSELVRTQSRGRASPSPRPGMRAAPVQPRGLPGTSGGRRARTEPPPNRRPSPFVYHHPHEPFGPRMSSRHSSPTIGPRPAASESGQSTGRAATAVLHAAQPGVPSAQHAPTLSATVAGLPPRRAPVRRAPHHCCPTACSACSRAMRNPTPFMATTPTSPTRRICTHRCTRNRYRRRPRT